MKSLYEDKCKGTLTDALFQSLTEDFTKEYTDLSEQLKVVCERLTAQQYAQDNVDLSPVRELISLQRRCSNNINQIAIHANTYGVYQSEITALQKDYADLWEQVNGVAWA